MADIKKVIIWVHPNDVIEGNITSYSYFRPSSDNKNLWVAIEVTRDEFVRLEDNDK